MILLFLGFLQLFQLYFHVRNLYAFLVNMQSFFAGLAASGSITSALRFITKAAFENSQDGLRKGAST